MCVHHACIVWWDDKSVMLHYEITTFDTSSALLPLKLCGCFFFTTVVSVLRITKGGQRRPLNLQWVHNQNAVQFNRTLYFRMSKITLRLFLTLCIPQFSRILAVLWLGFWNPFAMSGLKTCRWLGHLGFFNFKLEWAWGLVQCSTNLSLSLFLALVCLTPFISLNIPFPLIVCICTIWQLLVNINTLL